MTTTRRTLLTAAPAAALATSAVARDDAALAVMVSTWDFGAAANAAIVTTPGVANSSTGPTWAASAKSFGTSALVAFSRFNGTPDGNTFVFFIITVAAAEVAICSPITDDRDLQRSIREIVTTII